MNKPSIQDVLLTIQRNQQTIDLLTANNTQLTNYLVALSVQPELIRQPQLISSVRTALPDLLGVPDQDQTNKRGRGRPPKQLIAAAQPVLEPEPQQDNRAWTPERRAKQAATLARKQQKPGGEVRWTAAQKKAIGERSRQAWARRRAEGRETRNPAAIGKSQKSTWGGRRVKGQSGK